MKSNVNEIDTRAGADLRRRSLVLLGVFGGSGLLLADLARAQAQPLSETDATAQALGYKTDTAQVDAARFPKHAATQNCSNCNFFKADGGGTCQLFPGKSVSSKGWCSAYVAKA